MSNLKVNTINDASGGSNAVLYGVAAPANSMGFRNRLINGAMAVGQRGNVVFTSTNNLYGWVDRWLVSISGSTVSALGYQASGYTSGANATTSGYALQIGNLLTTGATTAAVSQRIESINCSDLNATTVTFSGKVQQSTGSTQTLTISVNKATAGVNNWSTQSVIGSTAISVPSGTSAWTPFLFTVTLGATDAVNGISANLSYNSLGAQSNSQLYFADCQLEAGSVASPFERRDYGRELIMCQRYYSKSPTTGSTRWDGYATATALFSTYVKFPVTMRATPVIVQINDGQVNFPTTMNNTGLTTESFYSYRVANNTGGANFVENWTASAEL